MSDTPERHNDPENTLILELKDGTVTIEMRPDIAPQHVERIKELVREGYYDGLTFHRVIEGFMAQGGCPEGTGMGGSGTNIPAEFSDAKHIRGAASMARSSDPNSGDSQFFIMFDHAPHLDGQYSLWGYVVDGMEHVDAIERGNPAAGGVVDDPDNIVKMSIAADAA